MNNPLPTTHREMEAFLVLNIITEGPTAPLVHKEPSKQGTVLYIHQPTIEPYEGLDFLARN